MKWVISSIVYLYIVSRANTKSLKKPKHIAHNCAPDEDSIQTIYLRKIYDSVTKENHKYDETNDSDLDYSNVNNHYTFSSNRRMNNDYHLGINYDKDSIKTILKRHPMKHTLTRRLDDENTEKNSNKALDAVLHIRELREQLLKHLVHYIKKFVNEISKTSKRTINIGKTLSRYYENNKFDEKNNPNDEKTTIEYDDEDFSKEHETVTEIIATTEQLETEILSKQEETGFNESQIDINGPVTDQEISDKEDNPTTSTYPNDNEPASTQNEETQNIDALVNDDNDDNAGLSESLKTVEREEYLAETSSTSEIVQENTAESSSTSEIEQENLTESPSKTVTRQDILPESPTTSASSTFYAETIGTTTVATESVKATIIASNYDNENKIISNELPDESTNCKNEENKEKQDIKGEISYGKSIAFNEDQNINDNIQDNDKIQNINDTIQDVNDNKDKIEDINDTNDKIKDFNDKAIDTVTSKDEFKEENTASTLNYSEIEKYIMNPFKAIASNSNRREGSKNTFLHLFLHLVMQK